MVTGIYNNRFKIIQKAKDFTLRISQNGPAHTERTKTLQEVYKVIQCVVMHTQEGKIGKSQD